MSQVEQMGRSSKCENGNKSEELEKFVMASKSLSHFTFRPLGGGRKCVSEARCIPLGAATV